MKRIILYIVALALLLGVAGAETAQQTSAPTAEIMSEITPEPTPAGTPIEGDELRVTLPAGFEVLDDAAWTGYDAALKADYGAAARTLLAAMDESANRALIFAAIPSELSAVEAAREAAMRILGEDGGVAEMRFGENAYAAFACAIGDQSYHLYYLSAGEQLLMIGASELADAVLSDMLESVRFGRQDG